MKILITDSTGLSDVSDKYRSFFNSNIKLIGHEPSKSFVGLPSGEHGYQCGYYAGALLNLVKGDHEIHFLRIFDSKNNWINGSENFILDVINDVEPDIVSNSWGMDDGDSAWGEKQGRKAWSLWSSQYEKLFREKQFVSFFAAGNDDKNDLDEDISFPQRLISDFTCVVGSHNKSGIPSRFSGDGFGVMVSMWGENVSLLNKYGKWERGSGTSFSCPKAAGLCAYLGLDFFTWKNFVLNNAQKPENWVGQLPHPKWGWGSLEYAYQKFLAKLPIVQQPPLILDGKVKYFDRKLSEV